MATDAALRKHLQKIVQAAAKQTFVMTIPKSPYRYWRPMNNGKSIVSASLTQAFASCALDDKISKL